MIMRLMQNEDFVFRPGMAKRADSTKELCGLNHGHLTELINSDILRLRQQMGSNALFIDGFPLIRKPLLFSLFSLGTKGTTSLR